MHPRKWVRRSLRHLAEDLRRLGHALCPNTVRRLLYKMDFCLRINRKDLAGRSPPDRDKQFHYIQQLRTEFARHGWPIISVDAKRKELVGNFANPGRAWRIEPEKVNAYDFIADAVCRATPYGIYEPQTNRGYVAVGTSSETGAFAVDAIKRWWRDDGQVRYPQADRLLILADSGGGNGCRRRLWKRSLQAWADTSRLSITVCHYPKRASKWNPVEHRLFSFISDNWAGQPLRSLATMLGWIRGTRNEGGLKVRACLLDRPYPGYVRVPDREMNELNLQRHDVCPQWNYTIRPRPISPGP